MSKEFFLKRYEKLGHKINEDALREEYKNKKFIRVNTLKITKKELIEKLNRIKTIKIKEIKEIPEALELLDKLKKDNKSNIKNKNLFSISTTIEYLNGYFYIQDLFSMIPAMLFNFPNNANKIKVLDAAAAPGSKTTQIAQYMKNKGEIVAIDNKSQRLKKLNNNLERLGIKNAITVLGDINDNKIINTFKETFDFILLDAPCSGNFMIDKSWFDKRDIKGVRQNSQKQKEMFKSCLKMLKKGGEIIYSTCSLEPEEDEENVAYFLNKYKNEIKGVELNALFNSEKPLKNALKLWPDKTKGQGFFVAKFRKM